MHPGISAEGPLNPGLVIEMLQAHQRTAALNAAIDLDVFRAVGEGPGDVASIARHCAASERGIRILCDFLTIYGVLVKEDGRYRHTPTSAVFLDPCSPSSLASIAQFLGNQGMRDPYEHLAEIVRTGRTVLPGDGFVEPENPIWVQFAESMTPMMARSRIPRMFVTSMLSRSIRASSADRLGVLPRRTTYFGPRTAAAGLLSTTWPMMSQSNSIRIAARCCFTVGAV